MCVCVLLGGLVAAELFAGYVCIAVYVLVTSSETLQPTHTAYEHMKPNSVLTV